MYVAISCVIPYPLRLKLHGIAMTGKLEMIFSMAALVPMRKESHALGGIHNSYITQMDRPKA